MKGIVKIGYIVSLSIFLITGCGNNAEIEKLKKENALLKEQLSEKNLNQEDTNSDTLVEKPDKNLTVKNRKLTKKQKYKQYANQIKVKVYNKKVLPKDYEAGRYNEFIEFDYKVINRSKKSVKGIKGTLNIYDQFEDLIMAVDWDISKGTIRKGQTKKITDYGIEYNQFRNDHNKVYSLKYKDMIFEYEMQQVNFSDGYKLKF